MPWSLQIAIMALTLVLASCQRIDSREEALAYLADTKNGLSQSVSKQGFLYQIRYQPNRLMPGMENNKEVLLFALEISFAGDNPLLHQLADKEKYLATIQKIVLPGNSTFILVGEENSHAPLATNFAPTFDHYHHLRIQLSFPVKVLDENRTFEIHYNDPFTREKISFKFRSKNFQKFNVRIKNTAFN